MVLSSYKLKWRTDLEKSVLINNWEKRGWTRAGQDDEWNIYWALPHNVKGKIFSPDSGIRLSENQIVNHFPNSDELCKKDLLVKNIKRYRKDLERDNNPMAEKDDKGCYIHMDVIPQTYIFPGDYNIFAEEFRRQTNAVWIMKPSHRAQGQGIFLVTKLTQLKKGATESKMPF
jgi:tubulin polyglutamylase TTLL1